MKKIVSGSFLCGSLRKKHPTQQNPIESSPDSNDTQQQQQIRTPTDEEEAHNQSSLPPPPGKAQTRHVRAASYHHHHYRSRSSSAVSRLTSSLSMKMRQSSRREDHHDHKSRNNTNNKLVHEEDLVWKKTIIMGEKCRVPDEDEDTVLYDDKGKKISTYHPKNERRSLGSLSRQNSATDNKDSIFDPPRLFGSSGKNR